MGLLSLQRIGGNGEDSDGRGILERSMKGPRALSFGCVWVVLRTAAASVPLAGLLKIFDVSGVAA